jgi:hypothetical protein
MNTEEDVKLIAALAREVEITDPIDWDNLNLSRDQVYGMMAAHVADFFDANDALTNKAILAKLLVENFTLNVRLESGRH